MRVKIAMIGIVSLLLALVANVGFGALIAIPGVGYYTTTLGDLPTNPPLVVPGGSYPSYSCQPLSFTSFLQNGVYNATTNATMPSSGIIVSNINNTGVTLSGGVNAASNSANTPGLLFNFAGTPNEAVFGATFTAAGTEGSTPSSALLSITLDVGGNPEILSYTINPTQISPGQWETTGYWGVLLVSPDPLHSPAVYLESVEITYNGTDSIPNQQLEVTATNIEAGSLGAFQSSAAPVPEPATMVIWSLLGAGGWLGSRVSLRRRGGPAGRQPWSNETRTAIHDMIARGAPR